MVATTPIPINGFYVDIHMYLSSYIDYAKSSMQCSCSQDLHSRTLHKYVHTYIQSVAVRAPVITDYGSHSSEEMYLVDQTSLRKSFMLIGMANMRILYIMRSRLVTLHTCQSTAYA